MGDEHDGGAVFLLQIVHQPQNLRLNGHVQSGGRLVGNQNVGLTGKSHGDHDTLPHTAGQLVGILLGNCLRVRDLHRFQHLDALGGGFLLAHALMDDERLGQLLLHAEHRVQAGHGFLKNNGNSVAPDVVHLLGGDLGEILSVKGDGAAGDIAVGIQQPQHAHSGDGLAGTGLTHDTQSLTGVNGIGNIVYSLDNAVSGFEKGLEVLDLQQRLIHVCHYLSTSDLGSSTSRRVSPMMLMQMTTMERNSAGNTQRHQ